MAKESCTVRGLSTVYTTVFGIAQRDATGIYQGVGVIGRLWAVMGRYLGYGDALQTIQIGLSKGNVNTKVIRLLLVGRNLLKSLISACRRNARKFMLEIEQFDCFQ